MDNEGEFAKTNYDNKLDRDALLSMLEPRLEIARQLLSDDGVIFCSIDDRNQAHLKLLFDRIFGEYNFIANIV
jgi:adenine-specific DNA-methyltransferase